MELIAPLYTVLVLGLVVAELREARAAQWILKPLAALGFCLIAVWCGAFSSAYGLLILTALILCAAGDVALLSRGSEKLFQLGMAAFALGHLIYAYAFFRLGFILAWAVPAFIVMGAAGFLMLRYLRRHMPQDMRLPVSVYIMIITAMVVTAAGTQNVLIITAALMFAVSDMFVARDRFVSRNPRYAIAISPLYFGAQALFAFSILSI